VINCPASTYSVFFQLPASLVTNNSPLTAEKSGVKNLWLAMLADFLPQFQNLGTAPQEEEGKVVKDWKKWRGRKEGNRPETRHLFTNTLSPGSVELCVAVQNFSLHVFIFYHRQKLKYCLSRCSCCCLWKYGSVWLSVIDGVHESRMRPWLGAALSQDLVLSQVSHSLSNGGNLVFHETE
jgi:hypothetical protein